ncbi:MAG: hypothetical protein ACE37F_23155 [Nannocystaceae bacterium]|nr:hypothetical protein [bacterium]
MGSVACFSPKVSVESAGGGDTELASSSTSLGDESGGTAVTSIAVTGTAEASGGSVDVPPLVTILLDGDESPDAITTHGVRVLSAQVEDDGEEATVELWRGDTLLTTLTTPPYEFELAFSSVDTGFTTYRALVEDEAGQVAEDDLEVSVNIAGGNLEEIDDGLWRGALLPITEASFLGGGVAEVDGDIYVSAARDDGNGLVYASLDALEPIWTRSFDGPVWAPVVAVGQDEVAVAVAESGDWRVHILEQSSGDTSVEWILGEEPAPATGDAQGSLGPRLAALSSGIAATTRPERVSLFSFDGRALDIEASVNHGVVSSLVASSDGGRLYVSFGDAFSSESGTCSTDSEFCAQTIESDGSIPWVTGLSQQIAGIHQIAPTGDGGAFVSATIFSRPDRSFEILKLSPEGVVVDSQLAGEVGNLGVDESGDKPMAMSPDRKGGLVVCGGGGVMTSESNPPYAWVSAYDEQLNLVWHLSQFVESETGAYGLACAATDEAAFVYGLRDITVDNVNGLETAVGDAWLARVSL